MNDAPKEDIVALCCLLAIMLCFGAISGFFFTSRGYNIGACEQRAATAELAAQNWLNVTGQVSEELGNCRLALATFQSKEQADLAEIRANLTICEARMKG